MVAELRLDRLYKVSKHIGPRDHSAFSPPTPPDRHGRASLIYMRLGLCSTILSRTLEY